ncbi:hypothetical protein KJ885_00640 [Patescibacteria group bacterium]|nr:hypothetical protein [Patescibacteria group bacterium]
MAKKRKTGHKGGEKSLSGLEQLFGSKTRFGLLKIFCQNTENKFFVRELARLTNNQLNAVRREVANLEGLGVIKEVVDSDTKKKFYKSNSNFILFNEINSLISKSKLLTEKKLVDHLNDLGNIELCVLSGSLAGEKNSPCDILIIGRINKDTLANTIGKFEKEINRPIIYTVFSPEDYKQRKSLTDKFLFSVLEGKKIVAIDKNEEFADEEGI